MSILFKVTIFAATNLNTIPNLKGEDDLNQMDGPSLDGGDAQRPTGESAPLPFLNGTWEQDNNDIVDVDQ